MHKIYRAACVLIGIVFFKSLLCSAENSEQNNGIKIGMLLPLSGNYAAFGVDAQQALEVAKLEFDPAVKIDFLFADSKGDPLQSTLEFKKLTTIDNVIGTFAFRGPVGMAVNPLSKQSKSPLLGGVGNKDFALSNPYAFQLWVRSDSEGEFLANKMLEKGFKKIAVVTVQDDWPVSVSAGLRAKAKVLGETLVYDEELLPSETDFRTQITKLRQLNADAIFLNIGVNQIAPFIKQLRDQGVKTQVFSNFWAGKKEVLAAAGELSEEIMFVEMSTNLSKLRTELKNRFNSTPSGATISAYVASILIAQALKGLQNPDAAKFYESLLAQKEVITRNGTFEIKDRFVQFPMVLRVIRKGVVEDVVSK